MMLSCSGQSAVVVGRGCVSDWRLMEWCTCQRVWADEGEGEREAAG